MFQKPKQVKKASAFSLEIDALTKSFTTMIAGLTQKAEEAEAIKTATEEQIKTMQVECEALQAESDRAKHLAAKISEIFN